MAIDKPERLAFKLITTTSCSSCNRGRFPASALAEFFQHLSVPSDSPFEEVGQAERETAFRSVELGQQPAVYIDSMLGVMIRDSVHVVGPDKDWGIRSDVRAFDVEFDVLACIFKRHAIAGHQDVAYGLGVVYQHFNLGSTGPDSGWANDGLV